MVAYPKKYKGKFDDRIRKKMAALWNADFRR